MKDRTFNINSWHFWLANYGTERIHVYLHHPEWCTEVNICKYIRFMIYGLIRLFVVAAICGGFVFSYIMGAIETVEWVYDSHVAGHWLEINGLIKYFIGVSAGAIAGAFMIGLAISWSLIYRKLTDFLYGLCNRSATPDVEEKEPSMLVTIYRKFKDKTCFKIQFVKDKK